VFHFFTIGDLESQKNLEKSFEIIKSITNQTNNPISQFLVGYCYKYGEGVEKNVHEAISWFKKATEQGHASAQYNMGCTYRDGDDGVERNIHEAILWFSTAAEQGHLQAQFNLGCIYDDGDDQLERNIHAAIYWWNKAAEQGHIEAQYYIAMIYFEGKEEEIKKNDREALRYFYHPLFFEYTTKSKLNLL